MSPADDPFFHHPELRDKIADPLQSTFRTTTLAELSERIRERGLPVDWWHTDSERDTSRNEILAGRRGEDLWVFAYGSLMWDPAIEFVDVRRARVPDHARCFILKDIYGGRGTPDGPGLMAALDRGTGCDGLLFRIAREKIDNETAILWQREKIGPAYRPEFVQAVISDQSVAALTFVADHDAELIDANLSRAEKIHYLATGEGLFGTSFDYLKNIASHFETLGIEDDEVRSLLRETELYIQSR